MTNKQIRYGYIPDKIEKEHYVLGASPLPQIILRPDGQWTDFLPKEEQQKKQFETYNCTSFNTLNSIEILFEEIFKLERNFSDRFTGITANTQPPGNSPHVVAEAIREYGLIDELLLPFLDTITSWQEYYSPNPLPLNLQSEGLNFLKQYSFGHEWVFTEDTGNEIERMKKAMQFSPLGASVYAWVQDANGLYVNPTKEADVHWICVAGYVEGQYWIIFDSYEPFIKHLAWDFPFGQVKRYHIEKKLIPISVKKNKWYSKVLDALKNIWKKAVIGGIILISAIGIYGSKHTQTYRNYPNPSLTPGLIRTSDVKDICGHTTGTYRKTTEAMKNEIYREYGIKNHPSGSYEIDHYYPLGIGGADDIKNLWAQPAPEFHAKDKIENQLRIKLCKKEITQQQAIDTINHWDKQNLGGIGQINDPDDE